MVYVFSPNFKVPDEHCNENKCAGFTDVQQ